MVYGNGVCLGFFMDVLVYKNSMEMIDMEVKKYRWAEDYDGNIYVYGNSEEGETFGMILAIYDDDEAIDDFLKKKGWKKVIE